MFCPNCGTEIEEGASFCHECGAKINREDPKPEAEAAALNEQEQTAGEQNEAPAEENTVQPEEKPENGAAAPVYTAAPAGTATSYYEAAPMPSHEGPAPIRMLKECASSGAFITAVIAFTVSLLATIASAVISRFASGNMIADVAARIDGMLAGMPEGFSFSEAVNDILGSADFAAIMGPLRTSAFISQLVSCVPAVLTAIGLWLIFAASKGKDPNRMSNGGFVVLKTIWIINLVFVCLGFLFGIGACVVGAVFLPKLGEVLSKFLADTSLSVELPSDIDSSFVEVFQVVLIFFAIIIAIAALFVILYHALVLKSINTANKTAKTGLLYKKASAFVAIILFLGVLNSLSSVFMLAIVANAASVIATVGTLTANVCFGVCIFNFNSKFTQLQMQG